MIAHGICERLLNWEQVQMNTHTQQEVIEFSVYFVYLLNLYPVPLCPYLSSLPVSPFHSFFFSTDFFLVLILQFLISLAPLLAIFINEKKKITCWAQIIYSFFDSPISFLARIKWKRSNFNNIQFTIKVSKWFLRDPYVQTSGCATIFFLVDFILRALLLFRSDLFFCLYF